MEKRFFKQLLEFDFSQPCALCTVMEWRGSVPRKDYPMMLVCDSGKTMGTIGGGTMEKEVIEVALKSLKELNTSLESFDFTNDDLSKDGGLCGGIVKVCIEPYTQDIQDFWNTLNPVSEGKTWLTTYNYRHGKISRMTLDALESIPHDFTFDPRQVKKNKTFKTDDAIHLLRFVYPESVLYIFGGGHVGKATAEMAHYIDLAVSVHDDRESFVSRDRFPHAVSRSHISINKLFERVNLQSSDLALVATRGHHYDLKLMRWILQSNVGWVGLVSSQRKWKLLSEGLENEGFSRKELNRVHAPVGMNIKAQTVPEIAVSILGQIIAYLRNKY